MQLINLCVAFFAALSLAIVALSLAFLALSLDFAALWSTTVISLVIAALSLVAALSRKSRISK